MAKQVLVRIRAAVRRGAYDMTHHASEEMAEDELDVVDVERSIGNGELVKSEKDDPRGTRYTVYGIGADHKTRMGTVGRFTETGRYLLVTVYKITEA